mmetsp:Transcript_25129/g.35396  ORF Transcript_25129/g.35396 Transcript_25129/m.35396 type:complete len:85 (-) Transcript_25129:161-415(-)
MANQKTTNPMKMHTIQTFIEVSHQFSSPAKRVMVIVIDGIPRKRMKNDHSDQSDDNPVAERNSGPPFHTSPTKATPIAIKDAIP